MGSRVLQGGVGGSTMLGIENSSGSCQLAWVGIGEGEGIVGCPETRMVECGKSVVVVKTVA